MIVLEPASYSPYYLSAPSFSILSLQFDPTLIVPRNRNFPNLFLFLLIAKKFSISMLSRSCFSFLFFVTFLVLARDRVSLEGFSSLYTKQATGDLPTVEKKKNRRFERNERLHSPSPWDDRAHDPLLTRQSLPKSDLNMGSSFSLH